MSPFLQTAIEAAMAAQKVIQRYYRQEIPVELKEDQSPVTIADVETERTIKGIIAEAFPAHGFFGEETGHTRGSAPYTWLIDPIDGTKSFVRHYPFFSTQIALMHNDELVMGVSSAPEFEEIAYAEKGLGAYLSEQPARVSGIEEFADATLSLGNIKSLAEGEGWDRLGRIVRQVNRTRGYGDFYHYHLLASGRIDLVIESDVNILDIAALSVIVREAGGVFTDMEGRDLTLQTTTVLAAATPALHAKALDLLRG